MVVCPHGQGVDHFGHFEDKRGEGVSFSRFMRTFFNYKGQVLCFTMQVVMNGCFLLNREKKIAQIRLVLFEKKRTINFEK